MWSVQTDNQRGELNVKSSDIMRSKGAWELSNVKKGVNKRINECVLR